MEVKKYLLDGNSNDFKNTVYELGNRVDDLRTDINFVRDDDLDSIERLIGKLKRLKEARKKISATDEKAIYKIISGE